MRKEIMFETAPFRTIKFTTGDCATSAEANKELIGMIKDHAELFNGNDESANNNRRIFKRFFNVEWVEVVALANCKV